MKNIIETLKAFLHLTADKNAVVKCNYPNNYYGDQCCQSRKAKA